MQSAEEHSSNGHTKSFLAEATELSLVKQLPAETETAKTPNSVTVTTEEHCKLCSQTVGGTAFSHFIEKVQQLTKPSPVSTGDFYFTFRCGKPKT